jgi:hypothetical protein
MKLCAKLVLRIVLLSFASIALSQQLSVFPTSTGVRCSGSYWDCLGNQETWFANDPGDQGAVYLGRYNLTSDNCPNGRTLENFRAFYKWDVSSIPINATITSATLDIWYSGGSDNSSYTNVTLSINKFANSLWDEGAQDRFESINIGKNTEYSSYVAPIPISTNHIAISYGQGSNFCTDVKNAISSVYFCLGFRTADDQVFTQQGGKTRYIKPSQGTHTLQGIKLTVNYTYSISVTVQNGFPGNGGTVTVDAPPAKTSPYTTNWTSGDSHTLTATVQTVNGNTYTPTGTWNVSTGGQLNQNPVTVNPIAPTIFTANFNVTTIQVNVDQRNGAGSSSIGNVGHWESNAWNIQVAPHPFPFSVGMAEEVLADQAIYSGEKYNYWSKLSSRESDVTNQHSFQITSDFPSSVTSKFNLTTETPVVKVELIDLPGNYTGTISFQDPWLIDFADGSFGNHSRNEGTSTPIKSRPAPFQAWLSIPVGGDVYKGVLLNQSGPTDNWLSTHYSVVAPSQQSFTAGGAQWSGGFVNWWGNSYVQLQNANANATAVSFTNPNAVTTAKYKANLGSSLPSATGATGQRKVTEVYVANGGYYHMVYESAGEIWYTYSSDGVTWSAEIMLSRGAGTAHRPSISELWDLGGDPTDCLYVAWVDNTVRSGATGYDINVRRLHCNNAVWDPIDAIMDPSTPSAPGYATANSSPAVISYREAYGYPHVIVAYEGIAPGGSLRMMCSSKGHSYHYPSDIWFTFYIPNSTGSQVRPSLTFGCDQSQVPIAYLTYDDGTNIYLSQSAELTYSDIVADAIPGNPTMVPRSVSSSSASNSVIDVDLNGRLYVEYTGYDVNYEESVVYLVSKDINNNWSSVTTFIDDLGESPQMTASITADPYYGGAAMLCYDACGNLYDYYATDGLSWHCYSIQRYPNARGNPNLIAKEMLYYVNSVITDRSSAPYLLRFETRNNGGLGKRVAGSSQSQPATQSVTTRVLRCVSLKSPDGSWLTLSVGNPAILSGSQRKPLQYAKQASVPDMTFLTTVPITATGNVQLTADITLSGKGWSKPLPFSVDLVDSSTNQVAGTLFSGSSAAPATMQTSSSVSTPISLGASSRSLYIRVNPTNDTSMLSRQFNEIIIIDKGLAKGGSGTVSEEAAPATYGLSEAYPNPFNPSTQIQYAIPEGGKVSLIIYDILGREVAELTNEYQQAGRYSVTWNSTQKSGTPVSSGVYFARLRVLNELGGVSFTKTSKLLLTK